MESICSICYEELKDQVILPCTHIFCRKCITLSLQQRQSCPLCRRVFCNLINKPLTSVHDGLIQSNNKKTPCFVYSILIPHNDYCDFNFFEKRYIEMISESLEGNLTFIIDPQYQDFCIRVKIVECVTSQNTLYICRVQNINREKVINSSFKKINNSYDQLKYVETEPIIDEYNLECMTIFENVSDSLKKILQSLPINEQEQYLKLIQLERNQETISSISLQLLSTIKINEKEFTHWYFSQNLKGRLKLIQKHYDSYVSLQ